MEVAPRYELFTLFTLLTLLTLLTWSTLLTLSILLKLAYTALHCQNISMFAYIYCWERSEHY